MKLRNKILGGLILSGAFLAGCTEDRVQKEVLKDQVYNKAIINGNDQELAAKSLNKSQVEYLYAPSAVTAGRQSNFARAYWLGEERIVTMEFDEFSMNIYSLDKETKFANNPSNKRLMMKIPVEHVDYRCADDAYGQCVGEEVKNDRITWDKKKYFKPDFERATITDPTFLPSGGLFEDCYSVKESKVVKASIDPDSMNFRIERAYQNNLYFYCIRGLQELEDLNWTDTTQYSFVRLDKVVSPDYQKAVYNSTWINTFGFFERNDYKLDVDGNMIQDGETKYISRWNPNRETITYHLSPEFNKPENAIIKAATYESFKRINDSLARANVKFRLVLAEPDENVDPADLRTTMIVLAEDPFEASVIGYGPSLTNPRTGEIISARTVMYNGSIKKFVRYTYDEILMQIAEEKSAKAAPAPATTVPATNATAPVAPATTMVGDEEVVVDFSPTRLADLQLPMPSNMQEMVNISNNLVDRSPELTETDMKKGAEIYANRDQIAWLAKEGFYPAELVSFGDVNQEVIQQLISAIGNLKPWETLTEIQKQSVIDTLVPYIWVPTLIHEVGHNLGLRHNFSGSEDTENYYTNDELKSLGVPVSTKNVPYSSIMDYPKSEINALRTFGKYDVAALNFGYNLKVQDANGEWVDIDPSANKAVTTKEYGYCSDEGIALNPNCNPFDEGKGYTEIVKSMIDSYQDRFFRGNFRRGRANFSTMDDDMYYSGVNRTFNKMRLIMELYQDLVQGWGVTEEMINDPSSPSYEALAWIRDLSGAVDVAGDFMMSVVNEPGMLCAISGPGLTGVQRVPIEALGKVYFNDCFGAQLNPQFKIEGQAGKFLNSYRVTTNPNRYLDQIDVRGTWLDKAAAMRNLFRRRMGNSANDKFNGNFMDHPKVAPKLTQFLKDVLNDNYVVQDLPFKDQAGNVVLTGPVGLTRSSDSYDIRAPEIPIVNWVLNTKYDKLNLAAILTQIVINGIYQGEYSPNNEALKRSLNVEIAGSPTAVGCNAATCAVRIGGGVYYADAENDIAFGLLQKINNSRLYETVTAQQLQDVYVLMVTSKPAPTDPKLLAIYNAGRPALEAYLRSARTPSTFFEGIVRSLASQNTFN